MIVLDDGRARVAVHPDEGAAIGRYDVIDAASREQPILQTSPSTGRGGPFALGLNLLVPFSNRISGGGFWHEGTFHRLERNTADPRVRIQVADENGLPGAELQKEETSERVQALYRQYSAEAEKLGVFGAPTFVLPGGERFWGQDRLDFLDRALS